MKSWILLSSVSLAMAMMFSPGFAAALSPESAVHFEDGVEYMPNVIIVAFAPEKVPLAPVMQNGVAITGIYEVDELNRLFEAVEMRQLFPGAEKHGEIEMAGYYSITFGNGPALMSLLEAYDALDAVGHVEPDGIHPVHYDPNDPMLPQQWAIAKIEATSAWDITRGDPAIVLGIPDTGVDWDHPDLEADVWLNEAEVNGTPGVDDDDNDYVDDFRGWDWVTGGYLCDSGGGEDCSVADNNPMDRAGHGSHVGGIASAVTDNGVGIAGLGFNCKIMPLRIGWLATNGGGYVGMSFAASAFYYATNNGAVGVNCSWGSSNSGGLGTATTYAVNNGLIVISSAGNNNNNNPSYLCGRSDVIAVAATNSSDLKASFSSFGTWVDISAPGVSIRSTVFNNSYANYDGTSMSSPHVLGLAGLIWSAEPSLPTDEVISRIYDTADNIDDLNPGFEGLLGSGRINAYAALASMTMPRIQTFELAITITDDDGDGILNPGESFELVVTLENIWADATNVTGTLHGNSVFSVSDSVASFGDIPHDRTGDNTDNPYVLVSSEDAIPEASTLVLNIQADADYETDLDIIIAISLDQSGFPLEIAGNIESSPLIFDFDMDGENELIVGANDEKVYAIEADGSNSPGWPQSVSGYVISGPAVGDLAANGSFQVVAVTKTGSFYAWDADGSLLSNFPVDKDVEFYSGVMLIDLDGDNDLEIVAGSSNNNIYVLNHDGSDYPGWPFIGEGAW
ncbi:MAG: S8 family serine peptidase, partial [candidate division Zixibacteria bacterium]